MSKIFFTSDLHFGHKNIIKFDNRPFFDVNDMNKELIKRWNNKVTKDDVVYVCGDFIWKRSIATDIIKELKGQIVLVKGNHDINTHTYKKYLADIVNYDEIRVDTEDGKTVDCILSHYYIPFYNKHRYGAVLLYGHSHNTEECFQEKQIIADLKFLGYKQEVYNVGCMHHNYEPKTLDELRKGE